MLTYRGGGGTEKGRWESGAGEEGEGGDAQRQVPSSPGSELKVPLLHFIFCVLDIPVVLQRPPLVLVQFLVGVDMPVVV